MAATILVATALPSHAQTYGKRNIGGKFIRSVTTTNNTATQIDAITVSSNETGFIKVTVWGQVSDTSGFVSGVLQYKYHKTSAGTLTVIAVDTVMAVTGGVGITAALFAASAVSNNIVIKVTGVNSKTIRWREHYEQWYIKND